MNRKLAYLLIAIILVVAIVIPVAAQMGIGTSNPDPSAAVDIVSTNQGVLLPRIASPSTSISSPAVGLSVYNTTDKCIQSWDGTAWKCAVGGSSGGSGATATGGGGIPQNTSASFPLLSVADAPDLEITMYPPNFTGAQAYYYPLGTLWLSDTRIAIYGVRRQTSQTPVFVLRILDDRLRLVSTYEYSNSMFNNHQVERADLDAQGNIVFVATYGADPIVFIINPNTGVMVKAPASNNFAPMPSLGGTTHPFALNSLVRMDDGNLAYSGYYVTPNTNQPRRTLVKVSPAYTTTVISAEGNYLVPTSFGFISVQFPPLTQLTYSAWDFNLNQIKTDAPLITNTNSVFTYTNSGANVSNDYNILRDGDFLYLVGSLFPAGTASPSAILTSNVAKLQIGATGVVTWLWETALPFRVPGYLHSYTSHNRDNTSIMELDGQGNLMITGQPLSGVPTGIYQDGTLNMGGETLPVMFLNTTTGAVSKTLTFDSPGVRTDWGTGTFANTSIANDDQYYTFAASPSHHRMLKCYRYIIDVHCNIFNPTTFQSDYALSNDGISHQIGRRFMVYDFNNNVNKIEVLITNGITGDLLGFDSDVTLAAGISKSYSFSQKKLTILGGGTNTTADYKKALNALVFSTDAGTGTRTLQAKIYDADGNINTTTFTIDVAN